MAIRPVFIPRSNSVGVESIEIEFKWIPGLALSQMQKNIHALHEAFLSRYPGFRPLEASTKAPEVLGRQLSPFHLGTTTRQDIFCCVESVFQACKVFQDGAGPFPELFSEEPRTVRQTVKAHEPSPLKEFRYGAHAWPLEPTRLFYDYLYCSALKKNPDLARQIASYDCFTDISCNPKKSLNCQAYAIALYRSLEINGKLEEALKGKDAFLRYHPKDTVFLPLERETFFAAGHRGNGSLDARIDSEMSRLRGAVQNARAHEVAQFLENEELRSKNQELRHRYDEAVRDAKDKSDRVKTLEKQTNTLQLENKLQAERHGKEKKKLVATHAREKKQMRSEMAHLEAAYQEVRSRETSQSIENGKLKDENQVLSSLYDEAAEEAKKQSERIKNLEEQAITLQLENERQAEQFVKEKEELVANHAREMYQLRSVNSSLEKKAKPSTAPQGPRKNIDSFDELRQLAQAGEFNHLAFSEEAWKQVPRRKDGARPGRALEMLIALNEVLWSILFEQPGVDVEKAFKERTPFEYAHGEGKQTKRDPGLASQRRFSFEGREWEMWPHIKYGRKKGKLLRIHFAIDNEAKRLIVGYIGEHMDNYTTQKMH